jgi:hypothetical protein
MKASQGLETGCPTGKQPAPLIVLSADDAGVVNPVIMIAATPAANVFMNSFIINSP